MGMPVPVIICFYAVGPNRGDRDGTAPPAALHR